MRLLTVLLCSLGLACADETAEMKDAGFLRFDAMTDAGLFEQDASTPDADSMDATRADFGLPPDAEFLADSGSPDANFPDAQAEDSSVPDAARDASVVDSGQLIADAGFPTDAGSAALGPIQCRVDVDCPGSLTCNSSAPGGICLGCGVDSDCGGADFSCVFGACVRDCSDDSDCNSGFMCGGTGRCLLRTCASGCPSPYVCGGNSCARPACANGACPAPLVCQSNTCVEP